MNRKIDKGALLNGLMLIAIGLLFLLDRLHIEDFGDLIRLYWPCIIILFGISHILRRESLWSGLWLVTVGVWLQIVHLHLFGLNFRNSWPLFLIALGSVLTLRAVLATPKENRSAE
ncbi:MAG: hypothetical protein DMF59_13060 [Acidobacteria bacterium]|nr:MAG: hypothetical protein DMF59_13060 [Acidobacteriota bacterium]